MKLFFRSRTVNFCSSWILIRLFAIDIEVSALSSRCIWRLKVRLAPSSFPPVVNCIPSLSPFSLAAFHLQPEAQNVSRQNARQIFAFVARLRIVFERFSFLIELHTRIPLTRAKRRKERRERLSETRCVASDFCFDDEIKSKFKFWQKTNNVKWNEEKSRKIVLQALPRPALGTIQWANAPGNLFFIKRLCGWEERQRSDSFSSTSEQRYDEPENLQKANKAYAQRERTEFSPPLQRRLKRRGIPNHKCH